MPPAPCHCCEPLLTGWQWVLFLYQDGCHITQHHHPTCKPLLVGGDGGADDGGMGNNIMNNNGQWGQQTAGMMNSWGTTHARDDEWQMGNSGEQQG